MKSSLVAAVALLGMSALPFAGAIDRKPSLLRGDKRANKDTSHSSKGDDSLARVLRRDATSGKGKRRPRQSVAIKGKDGSLGRVNCPVTEGNENQLMTAAEEELKRQLQAHFGGDGTEHIKSQSAHFDASGDLHLRMTQSIHGMEVEGAALVVHLDSNGTLTSINGEFCDEESDDLVVAVQRSGRREPKALLQMALEEAGITDGEWIGEPEQAMVRRAHGGSACLAWKQTVRFNVTDGSKGSGPQMDIIYADATYSEEDTATDMGSSVPNIFAHLFQDDHDALKFVVRNPNRVLCARHPQYMGSGIPRMRTYDCNGRTSSCSLRSTSSVRIRTGDEALDAAHNFAIATYDYFFETFGRDSLDGRGMELISRVHYDRNYNNAFWDGRQMTYGDGDGRVFRPLSLDCDVVAHELTHGLTSATSRLIYQDESGALNEAISDIFGAIVDRREGATGENIWLVGEDIFTPNTPGDAIRNMADPASAGDYDFYPTRYLGSADNGGVHSNSGIANLAFKLLVTGGRHPRGKTSVEVAGIGYEAAAAIFYWANVDCLTPSSTFELARFCTAETFGGEHRMNVHQAWDAVGVPGGPPPPPILLEDGVSLTGQSGNNRQGYRLESIFAGDTVKCALSGSSGDPDLYLRFGSEPGIWPNIDENACSSYTPTAQESCTTEPAPELTSLYILINAYNSEPYNDLTITCSVDRLIQPSMAPSNTPSASSCPSTRPSTSPTNIPSISPRPTTEVAPSGAPSLSPSASPSQAPTQTPSTFPTQAPTRKPTSPPTLPPVEPPCLPPVLGCFSGTTSVLVQEKGSIPMSELRIGDRVLTHRDGITQYEPVYSFGHYHETASTEFLQIFYDSDDGDIDSSPVEMTGNHLLFLKGNTHPIRADAIRVNDRLQLAATNATVFVTSIKTITRQGVYAPLTASGTIVIHSGVVASTYVSLQRTATEFMELQHGLALSFLPQQSMCHLWMAPQRLACQFLYSCREESYNDKGRPWWVQLGKDIASWILDDDQYFLTQMLVIGAVVMVLGVSALLETFIIITMARPLETLGWLAMAGITYHAWRQVCSVDTQSS